MLVAVSSHGSPPRISLLRRRARGVTVLPSAEGPSMRSDPRWTTERARRAQRFLDRLIARQR
jgi:hypothetical protein